MRHSLRSNATSVLSTESVNGFANGGDHDGDIYYKQHSSIVSAGGDIHMGMVPDFPMSHLMDYRTWIWYVEIWVCDIGDRGGAGWERCLVGVMGRKIIGAP